MSNFQIKYQVKYLGYWSTKLQVTIVVIVKFDTSHYQYEFNILQWQFAFIEMVDWIWICFHNFERKKNVKKNIYRNKEKIVTFLSFSFNFQILLNKIQCWKSSSLMITILHQPFQLQIENKFLRLLSMLSHWIAKSHNEISSLYQVIYWYCKALVDEKGVILECWIWEVQV